MLYSTRAVKYSIRTALYLTWKKVFFKIYVDSLLTVYGDVNVDILIVFVLLNKLALLQWG